MNIFLPESFQAILDDPVQLAEFLDHAVETAELAKVARTKAITLLLRGIKIPGWILRRHENSYVLPGALQPLALESLSTVLDAMGSISEERYRRLCDRCGVAPVPTAILKAGTTVVLARSNNQKKEREG